MANKQKKAAKAAKPRNMSKTLKVSVKGISGGKNKIGMGMAFDREHLSLEEADALLAGANVRVSLMLAKDVPGQETFEGKAAAEFDADCGRISFNQTEIGVSLRMDGNSDETAIWPFRFKVAKATIERIGNAKTPDDDDQDVPGQGKLGDDPTA